MMTMSNERDLTNDDPKVSCTGTELLQQDLYCSMIYKNVQMYVWLISWRKRQYDEIIVDNFICLL